MSTAQCNKKMGKKVKLLCCVLGIFVCYFYFAVLQERITRGKYGSGASEERFTYMLSLVLVQCVVNYIFAKVSLATVMKQGEDTTRLFYYASSAMTYLLAMICSTMALQWVAYPTQVVAKSGKPIPVLLLGVLVGRKSYPLKKYLFVLMIVLGIIMFMYKDNNKSVESGSSFGLGELLLVLSLLMDGLLGAIQERMRAEHHVKSGHLMLNMNLWSMIFVSVAVLLTGEIFDLVCFINRHPNVLWQMASLSVAGAFGQFFIHTTVTEFGPLPCSIITTTRKFFTILGSVLIFGNQLMVRQWIAAAIVFVGLGLDSTYGRKSKPVA